MDAREGYRCILSYYTSCFVELRLQWRNRLIPALIVTAGPLILGVPGLDLVSLMLFNRYVKIYKESGAV
jgi:hypothetical protein